MRCEGSLRQAENCNIFFIGENSFRDDFSPFFTRDRCPELAAPPVRFERRPIFSSATLLFERLPVCKRSGPSIISHLVNCRVRRRNHGRVAESGLRHSTRNRAWGQTHRGFESHPFRHTQIHRARRRASLCSTRCTLEIRTQFDWWGVATRMG